MKHAIVFLLATTAVLPVVAQELRITNAQVDAAMAKADTDGNGEVGLAEARKFGITMDTFRKANPDRDGSLDRKEFAAALREQFVATRPVDGRTLDWRKASRAGVRSKQTFDAADPDGDGKLDLAGYLSAMTLQAR